MCEESYEQILMKIGGKLAELRKAKGYKSQEKFADDHNLPKIQYWRLEKGRSNLTLKSLLRVLKVHDLTAEQFFSLLDRRPGP